MKSPLAWYYVDRKKSINACLSYKLNISEFPDHKKICDIMKQLSDYYPGLRSTLKPGFLGSVSLLDNDEANVFYRDQVFADLEEFAVSETNFNFKQGDRLYYVALTKFSDGKVGIAFNGHHLVADAVVQEAISEVFLSWILEGKEFDLKSFRESKTFTISRKGKSSPIDWIRFVLLFVHDYFSYMKKIPKRKKGNKTLLHKITIDKDKMPSSDKTRTNALLCGAFMKVFGETLAFGNSSVKTIHMVNVRTDSYDRNSPDFASSMVSALTVNQKVGEPLKTVAEKNLYYFRRSFKYSIAHLTSDLQYYFFRTVDLLKLGHVCHLCFSNTEKIDSTILRRFSKIDDVIGIPSLGKNSPYMTVILIDKPKSWGINVVYLENYFSKSQLLEIDEQLKKSLYELTS